MDIRSSMDTPHKDTPRSQGHTLLRREPILLRRGPILLHRGPILRKGTLHLEVIRHMVAIPLQVTPAHLRRTRVMEVTGVTWERFSLEAQLLQLQHMGHTSWVLIMVMEDTVDMGALEALVALQALEAMEAMVASAMAMVTAITASSSMATMANSSTGSSSTGSTGMACSAASSRSGSNVLPVSHDHCHSSLKTSRTTVWNTILSILGSGELVPLDVGSFHPSFIIWYSSLCLE